MVQRGGKAWERRSHTFFTFSGGKAWERRSHTFFTFCLKMILKLFQNGYFLDGSPHLFVSTASLTYFDFQLLMGTID